MSPPAVSDLSYNNKLSKLQNMKTNALSFNFPASFNKLVFFSLKRGFFLTVRNCTSFKISLIIPHLIIHGSNTRGEKKPQTHEYH